MPFWYARPRRISPSPSLLTQCHLVLPLSLTRHLPPAGGSLSKGEATHLPDKALLCPTSPSLLRNATSPSRGGSGVAESPASSPLRCEETSLPKAPLLGELASKASLRGCTKDGPGRRPQLAPPLGATTTTAACGRNREELLGQRPARRECRPRHEADAGCHNPELARQRLRGRTPYISPGWCLRQSR